MTLQLNDGQSIEVEKVSAENSTLRIQMLRADHESLYYLFSDEFATKKMIADGVVYEGYTILDQIIDHTGKIWEVVMLQAGSPEDKKVQDAAVKLAKMQAKDLDDTDANEVKYLFDQWRGDGVAYKTGDRVMYADVLYRVLQDHTSQADWTPDVAVSLFVRCDDPGEEWPEWRQPTGAQDVYAAGAKVSHNDKHWTSNVDANTWEPGVYGWTEAES